jgi:hypothetical protein
MRAIRTTLVLALLLAHGAAACAADDFPYEAYVAVERAEVVAGPGHRFYATNRLERGARIEIYREEPSGWLAIRPPEGAFSWTPAESIERLKDDPSLGRVKHSAAAWIGTIAEQVSEHRQQVTLKAGEMVQILGEKSVEASDEKQKWLKIAPPAGEFRWIHLRDVSRQMPGEVEEETRRDAEVERTLAPVLSQSERERRAVTPALSQERQQEEPRRFQVGERAIALEEIEPPGAGRIDRQVAAAQFQSATGNAKSLSPDGFVPRKRRTGDSAQPLPANPGTNFRTSGTAPIRQPVDSSPRVAASVQPSRTQPVSVHTPETPRASEQQLQQQLEQIEIDLSLVLAQDKTQWNLAPLRERVQQLVEQGADPVARGQARLVLDKIKQFEAAFDTDNNGLIAGRSGGGPSAVDAPRGEAELKQPADKSSLADPRYDAQGWLKPVVSRKTDKPAAPYAIVDQEGQPLCFVTPSPGLNLNRYLNKQVGLYGRRGMLEELKKPHVLAERVIDLERQWR